MKEINESAFSTSCDFDIEMKLKTLGVLKKLSLLKAMAMRDAFSDSPTYSLIFLY